MKKILTLAAISSVLAISCSKTSVRIDNDEIDSQRVPVTLSAGMSGIDAEITKGDGPITAGAEFTATVGGWVSRSGSADYTAEANWTAVTSKISGDADRQEITLTEQPYYEPDDADKTYMKAWYPEGTLSNGKVTFENPDGSVDAMLSREVVGSRKDKTGKNLVFDHLSTQLIFMVKSGEGLDDHTTINSIKVVDAELPVGFDLATGTAVFSPAADGGLVVGDIDGKQEITADAAQAGQPVMIAPSEGKTIRLEVTTSGNPVDPFDVTVTVDDTAVNAGTAYTITLTFVQQKVEFTASVTEWVDGTGESTII